MNKILMNLPGILAILTAIALLLVRRATANLVECQEDTTCASLIGEGSVCHKETGTCSNPFEGGCLQNIIPEWKDRPRVCNSDDVDADPSPCRQAEVDYVEVRINNQNWDSSVFIAWILQIVFSEILGVPTTVETALPDKHCSFYDPQNRMDYGVISSWESMARSNALSGECRHAKKSPSTEYETCSHIIPEVWDSYSKGPIQELLRDGAIDPVYGLGVVGYDGWFLPRFTAERDLSLLSYMGLQGEENREKLAKAFPRPTTWKDYCSLVSTTGCMEEDNVAKRAPLGSSEDDRMFVEGLYTGYFRETVENDCVRHPNNCTGHFADYPCGWFSAFPQQAYHLNIALSSSGPEPGSGGYTSTSQIAEIWSAANATKTNIVTKWWQPEPMYQSYLGTEAELIRVTLPSTTQECIDARAENDARCGTDDKLRVGGPEGVCAQPLQGLKKILSTGLKKAVMDPDIPDAIRSPAYDYAKGFQISELQIGELFDYAKESVSKREAVCHWVVNNLDHLHNFVPISHPQVYHERSFSIALSSVSYALGALSLVTVVVACGTLYHQRELRAIRFAQVEFLGILLFGVLILSIGGVVSISSPSDASCVASIWLVNVGYTTELVPLIIKVSAVNRLMSAAQKMRRVHLKWSLLIRDVCIIIAIAVIFLGVWTGMDPPRRNTEYILTDDKTATGDTIVEIAYYCDSESSMWERISIIWRALLLVAATVLAAQTRNFGQDFNESQTLAVLTYSHAIFLVLRVATMALSDEVLRSTLGVLNGMVYSCDAMAAVVIYFLPKFLAADNSNDADSNKQGSASFQGNVGIFNHVSRFYHPSEFWASGHDSDGVPRVSFKEMEVEPMEGGLVADENACKVEGVGGALPVTASGTEEGELPVTTNVPESHPGALRRVEESTCNDESSAAPTSTTVNLDSSRADQL